MSLLGAMLGNLTEHESSICKPGNQQQGPLTVKTVHGDIQLVALLMPLEANLKLKQAILSGITGDPHDTTIELKGLAKYHTKADIMEAVKKEILSYGPGCPFVITLGCAIKGEDVTVTIKLIDPNKNPRVKREGATTVTIKLTAPDQPPRLKRERVTDEVDTTGASKAHPDKKRNISPGQSEFCDITSNTDATKPENAGPTKRMNVYADAVGILFLRTASDAPTKDLTTALIAFVITTSQDDPMPSRTAVENIFCDAIDEQVATQPTTCAKLNGTMYEKSDDAHAPELLSNPNVVLLRFKYLGELFRRAKRRETQHPCDDDDVDGPTPDHALEAKDAALFLLGALSCKPELYERVARLLEQTSASSAEEANQPGHKYRQEGDALLLAAMRRERDASIEAPTRAVWRKVPVPDDETPQNHKHTAAEQEPRVSPAPVAELEAGSSGFGADNELNELRSENAALKAELEQFKNVAMLPLLKAELARRKESLRKLQKDNEERREKQPIRLRQAAALEQQALNFREAKKRKTAASMRV